MNISMIRIFYLFQFTENFNFLEICELKMSAENAKDGSSKGIQRTEAFERDSIDNLENLNKKS